MTTCESSLTPDQIKALIAFDPETGELSWLPRPVGMFANAKSWKTWNTRFSGRPALAAKNGGYGHGCILCLKASAHRVAWAIAHGEWPTGQIDHINGDRMDNRISNLRDVSRNENQRNMKLSRRNTSGTTGVCFDKAARKWRVRIGGRSNARDLGLFSDRGAAAAARKSAEKDLGYHENHGRS